MRLESRVAIVTGSSQGIGREICYQFFKEGALLVCADLRPLGRNEQVPTHEWIANQGGTAIFVEADVTKAECWEALVRKAVEAHGRLDMYVCYTETRSVYQFAPPPSPLGIYEP